MTSFPTSKQISAFELEQEKEGTTLRESIWHMTIAKSVQGLTIQQFMIYRSTQFHSIS